MLCRVRIFRHRKGILGHRGDDPARTNRVAAYFGPMIDRDRTGKGMDEGLRSVVDRHRWVGYKARYRPDIDNRAAGLLHLWNHSAAHIEGAASIDAENKIPLRVRRTGHGLLNLHACVVDQDSDLSEALFRLSEDAHS